jgi:hypothetical protein
MSSPLPCWDFRVSPSPADDFALSKKQVSFTVNESQSRRSRQSVETANTRIKTRRGQMGSRGVSVGPLDYYFGTTVYTLTYGQPAISPVDLLAGGKHYEPCR